MPVQTSLKRWCENRPRFLCSHAIQVASSAQDCADLLSIVCGGVNHPAFTIVPPIAKWLPLYRSHRTVIRRVSEAFAAAHSIDDAKGFGLGFADGLSCWSEFSNKNIEERKSALNEVNIAIQSLSDEERAEVNQALKEMGDKFRKSDDISSDTISKFFDTVEVQFFFRVAFPCWLLYGQTVTRLYQRARHKNFDALDDLLRLDKALVGDQTIASRIMWARLKNDRLFKKLNAAISGNPDHRISISKVKASLAGLISKVSRYFPEPLTAPDIRGLFDALAADAGKIRDTDIPAGDDAWAKAIQRERLFWESVPLPVLPGQKSPPQVSG